MFPCCPDENVVAHSCITRRCEWQLGRRGDSVLSLWTLLLLLLLMLLMLLLLLMMMMMMLLLLPPPPLLLPSCCG